MNYRELQLRQVIKRDYVPKQTHQSLELEKALLAGDLEALRTSLDFTNLAHWERENWELKEELAQQAAFLADQHSLVQTLENTSQEQETTIQDLSQALSQKTSTLAQQKSLLRQLLVQKQEQLREFN